MRTLTHYILAMHHNPPSPVTESTPLSLRTLTIAVAFALASVPTWAATFTVNNNGDAPDAAPGDGICATVGGVCTLRAAIQEANALSGTDTIQFNIGGGGAVTISPSSALPDITSTLHVDGYTQPGANPNTQTTGSDAVVLVRLDGTSAGVVSGVAFRANSDNSSVRGLMITGFGMAGIAVTHNASGINIAGNYIGTDASGADLGNASNGIHLVNTGTVWIGTVNAADRNVIGHNNGHGIAVADGSGTPVINNNYIGTSPNGRNLAMNTGWGVQVSNRNNVNILNNVITGYLGGINVSENAQNTVIQGNHVGLSADGVSVIANGNPNVPAIFFEGGPSSQAPSVALVGGINPGQRNIITGWGGPGVMLDRPYASYGIPSNIQIRGNAIYDNGGLGIDLVDSGGGTGVGVNPNDTPDVPAGTNIFLNYPVVSAASTDGSNTTVSFSLQTYASGGPFAVDVYASPTCDASGHGEGRTWLGSRAYSTDVSGLISDTITGLPATSAGQFITLTNSENVPGWYTSTSEFSACVAVAGPGGGGGGTPQPVPTLGWLGQLLAALAVGAGAMWSRKGMQKT